MNCALNLFNFELHVKRPKNVEKIPCEIKAQNMVQKVIVMMRAVGKVN